MSDTMMFAIAKMPYELAMSDELSMRQFYANTQRLVAALEAARDEVESLRTDAERYRWLREEGDAITVCEWSDGEWIPLHPKNIDAAIDAAMKADG